MDEAAPVTLLGLRSGWPIIPSARVRARKSGRPLWTRPPAGRRPILLEILAGPILGCFVAILHHFSQELILPLAAMLFEHIEDDSFA